jgi:hypothetical protein
LVQGYCGGGRQVPEYSELGPLQATAAHLLAVYTADDPGSLMQIISDAILGVENIFHKVPGKIRTGCRLL